MSLSPSTLALPLCWDVWLAWYWFLFTFIWHPAAAGAASSHYLQHPVLQMNAVPSLRSWRLRHLPPRRVPAARSVTTSMWSFWSPSRRYKMGGLRRHWSPRIQRCKYYETMLTLSTQSFQTPLLWHSMRLSSSPILHSTKIVGFSMWQSATSAASQDREGRGLDKPIGKAGNIANPGK